MDGMVSYSMDYTTSAECRQIRVSLYNERFLNGKAEASVWLKNLTRVSFLRSVQQSHGSLHLLAGQKPAKDGRWQLQQLQV